jgi:hypothetical protein
MKTLAAAPLLALLLLAACDRPEAEICQDLDDLIAAKAAQLPRACREDADCALLTVSPALTVATNGAVDDPELAASAQRRDELCPSPAPDRTIYAPACVERVCEALPNGLRPEPDLSDDVGADTSGDLNGCACATSADCPAGGACLDGCTCDPICQQVCENVDRCGALLTYGLGSSLEKCLLRCAATVEADPDQSLPVLRCFARSDCDALGRCQP